jgi:hypothetical protein
MTVKYFEAEYVLSWQGVDNVFKMKSGNRSSETKNAYSIVGFNPILETSTER